MSGGDRQFQLLRDETEIEAARRLRDAVLANISHEFKTPLAAQLASLELLVDRLPDLGPDETRALIVSLQRGALRLTQLIDNLLESVRIEAGARDAAPASGAPGRDRRRGRRNGPSAGRPAGADHRRPASSSAARRDGRRSPARSGDREPARERRKIRARSFDHPRGRGRHRRST
jgi:hypothetical protein